MKLLLSLLCLGILSGCTAINYIPENQIPVLLVQYPFPSIPPSICRPGYMLMTYLFISEDGSVKDVKLNSGIKEWDSIAVSTIKTWKYSPLRVNDKPVAAWVHQRIRLKIAEPLMFSIAAAACSTYDQADSVYMHLNGGYDLKEAAKEFSALPVQGDNFELGEIDIYQYPDYIRNNISKLNEGDFTKPLKYNDRYIIFLRMKKL
jgi:hypothetical protein